MCAGVFLTTSATGVLSVHSHPMGALGSDMHEKALTRYPVVPGDHLLARERNWHPTPYPGHSCIFVCVCVTFQDASSWAPDS